MIRLLLLLLLLPGVASAVPSGQSGELAGSATPSSLAVSDDERFIAVSHAGSGGLTIFDRTSFLDGGTTLAVCDDATDVVFTHDSTYERFYVACPSATVKYVTPDTSVFPATWTVSDAIALTLVTEDFERSPVLSLDFAPGDDVVHFVLQADAVYDLWTVALATDSATRVGTDGPYLGTATHAAIGESGTPWILADRDLQLTQVNRTGGVYDWVGEGAAYPSISDVVVSNALDRVYIADSHDSEVWYVPTTLPLSLATEHPGAFTGPVALAMGGTSTSPFLWVGETGGGLVAAQDDGTELLRLDLSGSDARAIAPLHGVDGPAYVVDTGGSVQIIADRPFVSEYEADTVSVGPGDEYTLFFTANADAAYSLRVGGDLDPTSGTQLDAGALTADEESSVTLAADDLPLEGANRVFLFVDGGGDIGNDSIAITFDGPPDALGTPTVGAANERLTLSWTSSDEPDITTFEVLLSDEAFDPAEGLPRFTTSDGTSYPREVTAGDVSTTQSLSVEGLVNGTTYWLSLRAVDAGGQMGPFTAVVSGAPRSTCGAAECAGEPTGCNTCSSLSASDDTGGAWLLLGLLGLLYRRT